ncbi:hypothetical protein COTS27_00089 [Spirochaetota bacterium]|nr:hypothetical protein COTS27_00089 [Spirochaetota bacterium]
MFFKFKWQWWWWKFITIQKIRIFLRRYQFRHWSKTAVFIGLSTVIAISLSLYLITQKPSPLTQQDKLITHDRRKVTLFNWHRLYEIDTFGQILASPLISALDANKGGDILIANSLGAIYGFAGNDGSLVYEFNLGERIIASPFMIDVGTITSQPATKSHTQQTTALEPFIIAETGLFYVLAITTAQTKGDYLYRSRNAKRSNRLVFGTPAYGITHNQQGMVFIGDNQGTVSAYESRYGRLVWTNDISFDKNEVLFAPPVLLLTDHLPSPAEVETIATQREDTTLKLPSDLVIAASTKGTIAALNAETGAPNWIFSVTNEAALLNNIEDGVRSAMNVGNFLTTAPGMELALITHLGKGELFSAWGERYCQFNLNGLFVSALGKGIFYTTESKLQLLAISTRGDFYTIGMTETITNKTDVAITCDVRLLAERNQATFLSSAILEDFNGDHITDILIASRQGELFLLNGQNGEDLLPPLALGYALTATPAVADMTGDGNIEVILAGENGTVTVLTLLTRPENNFKPYENISKMFLRTTHHHN